MPPSTQPRVFLSYAHRDWAELAQRLHPDLTKAFDIWLDTKRLTAGEVWSRQIEEAINRSDVLVALLSEGGFTSDICRAEQIWALDEGKCVIPLLVQSEGRMPLHLKARQYLDFSNQAFYFERFPNLIAAIEKKEGVVVPPELLGRYNNTPALPQKLRPQARDTRALPQYSVRQSGKPNHRGHCYAGHGRGCEPERRHLLQKIEIMLMAVKATKQKSWLGGHHAATCRYCNWVCRRDADAEPADYRNGSSNLSSSRSAGQEPSQARGDVGGPD